MFDSFQTSMVAEQSPYLDLETNLFPDPTKEREDYSVLHLDLKLMHVHLTLVLVQFISVSTILMERQAQGPGGLGGLAGGGLSGGGTQKRDFEPERVYVCII